MAYVQLSLRRFDDLKLTRGAKPVFGFDLDEHETIVGVEHYWTADYERRATVDHHITVWVATNLGEPA